MKTIVTMLALALVAAGSAHAADKGGICGPLTNGFGPFDYRLGKSVYAEQLTVVENHHFSEELEKNLKGMTAALGGDLDYTLRAFPNHTRALSTMVRAAQRDKKPVVPGAHYPVECYFDRAIRFQPDDAAVRAIYANYLYSLGQTDTALNIFKTAVELDPRNATINYNLGLAYFKVKDYANANLHAQRAYMLGFPLPGLKNKLLEVKKWDDKIELGMPTDAELEAAKDAPAPAKSDEARTEVHPKAEAKDKAE